MPQKNSGTKCLLPRASLEFLGKEKDVEFPHGEDEGIDDHHGFAALDPELETL